MPGENIIVLLKAFESDKMRAKDLEELTGYSHARFYELLNKAIEMGLVKKCGKRGCYELTEEGEKWRDYLIKYHERAFRRTFEIIDEMCRTIGETRNRALKDELICLLIEFSINNLFLILLDTILYFKSPMGRTARKKIFDCIIEEYVIGLIGLILEMVSVGQRDIVEIPIDYMDRLIKETEIIYRRFGVKAVKDKVYSSSSTTG